MADQAKKTTPVCAVSAFNSSGVTKYIDEDDDERINLEIIETIRPIARSVDDKKMLGTATYPKIPPKPVKRKPRPADAQLTNVQSYLQKKPKFELTPISFEVAKIINKPPLPPKPQNLLKRKLEQYNELTVNKLSAQTEQLRLEITELKTALFSERNAVRVLRAQHESENRKTKTEIKRLQELVQKENNKKSAVTVSTPVKRVTKDNNTQSDVIATAVPPTHHNFTPEISKLISEISALKDANRFLEEKYQISIEAERRKTGDIRELKDSYELRLTQITKSAKCEINRLLEELKMKERNIGLMKKEVQSLKSTPRKDATKIALRSQEMRNSIEIEHLDASTETNQLTNSNNFNKTTCENDLKSLMQQSEEITRADALDVKAKPFIDFKTNAETNGHGFKSLPHEFSNRLMEAHSNLELQIIKNELNMGSDSDSAVSSAPPSLSPQPSSYPNSPDVWKMNVGHEHHPKDAEKIEKLVQELAAARDHIKDLEEALEHESRKDDRTQKLREKIKNLSQREETLQKETNELREQNELLEFRIIELEETHDKWSLRSHSSPDTKDVWTDTEKEPDDILLMSDHSDSGIISPNSHHQLEDHQSLTPCDLSLMDQIPNEEVRKRLAAMSKRACYDDEDRMCLMQIVTLINNLEALSIKIDHQESNDNSLESIVRKYKISEYPMDSNKPVHRSLTLSPSLKNQGKIVATIQPYSNSGASSIEEQSALTCSQDSITSTASVKRVLNKSWLTNSLQESGVFESDSLENQSQATQTEIEDFPCLDKTNAELCAEIDKLNKFREKIEECSAKKSGVSIAKTLTPQTLEQRRVQYYQERLLQIENKLMIYESNGDLQVQRLAERLQRELHLESLVKQLSEKIMLLESVNYNLEDERCELEEIENDTRLRLQRLEIDLEVLNQSNIELEMSRSSYMNKFQDAKNTVANLEESLIRAEERIFVLEEHENELKHKLDMITAFMPAILLFNSWKTHEDIKKSLLGSTRLKQPSPQSNTSSCLTLDTVQPNSANPNEIKLHTLMNREKELMQNIAELNRAYNETLENADNLWAQMEKEYKNKIARCEEEESNLKSKIVQLEDSLRKDHVYAQERISALEENEGDMMNRISKLNRENKELHVKHTSIQEELQQLREEFATLQNYIKGPAVETLDKEKRKVRKLEDELMLSKRMIENLEDVHKDEINMVKNQLMRTNKELTHIEVTNSELREEVETLETRIRELMVERAKNEEKLQRLSQELQGKQNQVQQMQQIVRVPNKSLAQELGRPVKRNYTVDGSQIHAATRQLSDAIEFFEENIKSHQSGNSETKEPTKEVKSLSDSIISSAEARGPRPVKKSFVEEARSRLARWV